MACKSCSEPPPLAKDQILGRLGILDARRGRGDLLVARLVHELLGEYLPRERGGQQVQRRVRRSRLEELPRWVVEGGGKDLGVLIVKDQARVRSAVSEPDLVDVGELELALADEVGGQTRTTSR